MLKETQEKYEKGKEIYSKGNLSLTQISKQLKIHRGRFSEYLKEQDFKIINKQNIINRYSDIFSVIDTEEKAYWLGFLYADGYVSSKTTNIELGLAITDLEHVKKFAKFINHDGKIITNESKARICFRDKQMYSDLIKQGCIPKKSLELKFPTEEQVSPNLIRHFVRGFLDGDGYIGMHTNGFGRISITCGSKQFIEDLVLNMNWKKIKFVKTKEAKP